jgi:hypothetical protein
MLEQVQEPVNVIASFTQGPNNTIKVRPHYLIWRGRRYRVDKFGLYHPERRGTKRIHIFSFSSGSTSFRVELDPETLLWTLAQVYYAT